MKINKKALELIEKGLSSNTVSKLTESQVQILHSKLFISEQVTEVPAKKTYKVGPKGGKIGNVMIAQDPNTKEVMVTAEEGEMKETETDDVTDKNALGADALQSITGQDAPHMANDMAPDGMDDDSDDDRNMMGMSEEKEKSKKNEPNPWAICHSQVGPKKSKKWERCVKEVKKQLAEIKNSVSLYLESQIMKIVEKNLPPRITKGDLMKYLTEQGPAVAPTKPKVKPKTKPQRPAHPGKNPNPGENPAPKAKKETNENSPSVAPSKPKTKPTTKPGTKPQRPPHPGKNPNPGENPAPKAKRPSAEEAKDKVMDVILNLLQN
jgi:hypothetical protein